MNIYHVDLNKYLTTTVYDPSPNRFSVEEISVRERTIPIIYTCMNCYNHILFKPLDFEKHNKSDFTKLQPTDKNIFDDYIKFMNINDLPFIDFYCPKCKLATTIIFNGSPSGYWGVFEIKIKEILVIK